MATFRKKPENVNVEGEGSFDDNDKEKLLNSALSNPSDTFQHEATDIRGDRCNIALLFFLYLLQGIPLGLISAIPMLLQNRGASYSQQAEFSFAYWPFSLKLLWAPIVDSLYWSKFGRRKSWLIPSQYMIGICMCLISLYVDEWLGGDGREPAIPFLTAVFFGLNFLAATQDIAVDGWALTMLKRCNVSYASTCNSVGQTAGYFLGYVVFIALESKDFCNSYLRTVPLEHGIFSLPDFLWMWGIILVVTTTLVALFKKETDELYSHDNTRFTDHMDLDIQDSYKVLFKIIKMKPILILSGILLTVKVTFAASDAVTPLKLIDAGIPKEKLAILVIPIVPLQIILPLIVSRYTNGPKPMDIYTKAIPYRMVFSVVTVIITYFTPSLIDASSGTVPFYYYLLLVGNYALYQICLYSMFVAAMAFFAKISDPAVGGTYMTLLNTLCNLGGNWPNTVVLWMVDALSWKECLHPDMTKGKLFSCDSKEQSEKCAAAGGECGLVIDGYYVESVICIFYGVLWLYIGRRWIKYLQDLPPKDWCIPKISLKKTHKALKLS